MSKRQVATELTSELSPRFLNRSSRGRAAARPGPGPDNPMETKAALLETTASSMETDLDLARSRRAHHLSSDNEEGERSGVVCDIVMPFPGVWHSRVGPDPIRWNPLAQHPHS